MHPLPLEQLADVTPILVKDKLKEEQFLRRRTKAFDSKLHSKKELQVLARTMRRIMKRAEGIGLSANQVGLEGRFFVAEAPIAEGQKGRSKLHVLINPEITRVSKEMTAQEEGCLSVPGLYGTVARHEKVTIEGTDAYGKKITIRARGLLARIFQHEMDHLNGVLFIDKATEIHKTPDEESLNPKP